MTDAEARMILHDLEHQGASSLSMEQIYAIRRAQGALDDISEAKRLLKLAICELGDAQDCDSCIADCSIGTDCTYKWHCSNEAEKLLKGGDTDGIAIQET